MAGGETIGVRSQLRPAEVPMISPSSLIPVADSNIKGAWTRVFRSTTLVVSGQSMARDGENFAQSPTVTLAALMPRALQPMSLPVSSVGNSIIAGGNLKCAARRLKLPGCSAQPTASTSLPPRTTACTPRSLTKRYGAFPTSHTVTTLEVWPQTRSCPSMAFPHEAPTRLSRHSARPSVGYQRMARWPPGHEADDPATVQASLRSLASLGNGPGNGNACPCASQKVAAPSCTEADRYTVPTASPLARTAWAMPPKPRWPSVIFCPVSRFRRVGNPFSTPPTHGPAMALG